MAIASSLNNSLIANRLISFCYEMGETILRTARSPICSEGRDFAVGILDEDLRLVAQACYTPQHLATIALSGAAIAGAYGADVADGDVFIMNDPYSGNNHCLDLAVAKAVFFDGQVRFWIVTKMHHGDMGGGGVLGYNPSAADLWEEGLRIPPLRLARRGRIDREIWKLLLSNVRLPQLVEGDLQCQIGALSVGESNLRHLIARFGAETIRESCDEYMLGCEQKMRSRIRGIPNGSYSAEQRFDLVRDLQSAATVRVCVSVEDDALVVDFTGTDEQVAFPINCPLSSTLSLTYLAVLTVLGPGIRQNAGSSQPITVLAPRGCLLNPIEPAPTAFSSPMSIEVGVAAIWLALSKAVPERVSAGWARWCSPATAGIGGGGGRRFAEIHFLSKGGGGASHGADGWDHVAPVGCLGSLRAPDVELHELVTPYRVLEYQYATDSAGPGQWRGGLGVRYRFLIGDDRIRWVNFGGGTTVDTAPFGLCGGYPAPPTELKFLRSDGTFTPVDPNSFSGTHKGDIFEIVTSGGGGYGDPLMRPIDAVLADVEDGVVSEESALRDYGVRVDIARRDYPSELPGEAGCRSAESPVEGDLV